MKKIILSIAILCSTLSSFGQTTGSQKKLIGKWAIEEGSKQHYFNNLITNTKKSNPAAAAQMETNKEGILQLLNDYTFDYKADGTLEVLTPQGPQLIKWKLVDNNTTIETVRTNGTTKNEKIIELSATKLKLINADAGYEEVVFIKAKSEAKTASKNDYTLVEKQNDKNAINKLIGDFKTAIIKKDSVTLTSLFYNNTIVWISAAHKKSLDFVRLMDKKRKQVDTQGAYQMMNDPRYAKIKTEEVFYNPVITTDGEIGSVSFSYKFLSDEQVSNWGSENWQLVKVDNDWKILHLLYSYHFPTITTLPTYMK
jgi:hypothetical protein